MGVIATLILTTAIAGVVGTGLGGLVGALLQKDSNRTVSLLLSFAGGVMLSVVCFDLVVEAIETNAGLLWVVLSIAIGVAVTYLLNYLIDRGTDPEIPHIDENHPKTADDLDELIHFDHLEHHYARHDNKLSLFVAGIVMAAGFVLLVAAFMTMNRHAVQVTFTDAATGETLIEEETTTFSNGFAGFWVPSHTTGTIEVTHQGRTGTTEFSTGEDGATCVTDLRLT